MLTEVDSAPKELPYLSGEPFPRPVKNPFHRDDGDNARMSATVM